MAINQDREMLRTGRIRAMQSAKKHLLGGAHLHFRAIEQKRWRERRRKDADAAMAGGHLSDEAVAMCRRYVEGLPYG